MRDALIEVARLCGSAANHGGGLRANNLIKYTPDESVLKLDVGEPIRLNAAELFDPAVVPALDGIRPGDQMLVLTWLHLARRDVLRVHPRGDNSSRIRILLPRGARAQSPRRGTGSRFGRS